MISFIKVVKTHYLPSLNGIVASDKLYNRYNSSVLFNPSISLHAINIDEFKEFCEVDLQLAHRTAITHASRIRNFLRHTKKQNVSTSNIRQFLKVIKQEHYSSYGGFVSSIKIFFRDYLNAEYLVRTFKHPRPLEPVKHCITKKQIQVFYKAIKRLKEQAYFLILASSGLRKGECLSLTLNNLDMEKRMITPNSHGSSRTKHSYVTFYNEETEEVLRQYLESKRKDTRYIFTHDRTGFLNNPWKEVKEETGIYITPRILREWFCNEMGMLGVQDRYIDAFCGRVPRSILARHYTDYSPERLKRIYDKANLRVLS
jgi:integrase